MPRYRISLISTDTPDLVIRTTAEAIDDQAATAYALSVLNWQRVTHPLGHHLDVWVLAGHGAGNGLPRIIATGKVETD